MAQAHALQAALAKAHSADPEEAFPILAMSTTGDRITDRALLAAGGKGLFTKELEVALLNGEAAFAVHSMKDVPTTLPDGLEIAAMMAREDPRDVLLSNSGATRLADLPEGARLGTASIRRQAQALNVRPDLKPVLMRGNVDTRLSKLKAGEADATFLARAGLRRLGRAEAERPALDPDEMLPACAQGAVGMEIRSDDDAARAALALIDHAPTRICATAERAFLAALDGSCRTPIAAYAVITGEQLSMRGEALTPDGQERWGASGEMVLGEAPFEAAERLGRSLGEEVRVNGGETLRRAIAETG